MLRFFDVHTHVQFAAFDSDRPAVINRALQVGVGMINVGTQKDTSERALRLAREYDNLYAAVGLHPIHTSRSYHDPQELGDGEGLSPLEINRSKRLPLSGQKQENGFLRGFTSRGEIFDYDYYKKLAEDSKVVAIGECGLDYAVFVREQRERLQKRASAKAESDGGLPQETIESKKNRQKEVFIKQIKLAHEIGKPLMIHCRAAFPDLIETLIHNSKFLIPNNPGIIHFFSGTKEDAKKLLNMGFYFTFGGVITFARDYDEVIRMIPADKILSETDAPYVAPAPYRGERNEPAYVIEIVKKLAEIRNVSAEKMAEQILKNVKKVFSI